MSRETAKRFTGIAERELTIDPDQLEMDEKAEIKTRAQRAKKKPAKRPVLLKLEEDLILYLDEQAKLEHTTRTHYIRQLILKDMQGV